MLAPPCSICGGEVISWPDPPAKAICDECCGKSEEGHEFEYEGGERTYICEHCGMLAPYEWLADRFDGGE